VEQEIRFTAATGPRVAWATSGSSPALPTLVVGGWWCSHLELDWQNASFRAFAERLATRFRVVRYDRPGTGLSDRDVPPPPDLDEEIAVLDAVVRAATDETSGRSEAGVLLLGVSSGSCVAVRYAATHAERVRRLALYGSYADGHDLAPDHDRFAALEAVDRGRHAHGQKIPSTLRRFALLTASRSRASQRSTIPIASTVRPFALSSWPVWASPNAIQPPTACPSGRGAPGTGRRQSAGRSELQAALVA